MACLAIVSLTAILSLGLKNSFRFDVQNTEEPGLEGWLSGVRALAAPEKDLSLVPSTLKVA